LTAQTHDGGHAARGKPPKGPRRRPRRKRRSKAWNLVLAILFLILGIIGVLLPIVPQIPFFIMSLLFFSFVFPAVRRALRRFLRRHPKIAHAYKKWRDQARRKRLELIRKEREFFGMAEKEEKR
jgi:cytochrome b561